MAKGDINFSELLKIICHLDYHLSKKQAYIDDFLICPHFGNKKYKNIDFNFFSKYRKPNPGMLVELAQKYRINLKKSFMIGDTDIDILTGKRKNLKTILVKSLKFKDYRLKVKPDFKKNSLYDAVKLILKNK